MIGLDLTALQPLLYRLEVRAAQWQARGMGTEVCIRLRQELGALQHCQDVSGVRLHLAHIRALESELPEADITLIRALQEAVDTWL